MRGAISLLPLCTFMACSRVNFTFALHLNQYRAVQSRDTQKTEIKGEDSGVLGYDGAFVVK